MFRASNISGEISGGTLGKLLSIQPFIRGGPPRHSIEPASSEGFGVSKLPSYKKNHHLTSEAMKATIHLCHMVIQTL